MWLEKDRNKTEKTFNINWVRSTKCLGHYFGYNDINSLNQIKCLDNFRSDILKHLNRETTIIGKVNILNYIGYSKLWFKGLLLDIPDRPCKRKNGKLVDIRKNLFTLSQGFIWGFNKKNDGMELDLDNPKIPKIGKDTLCLKKDKGGLGLIDYAEKMKSFRIQMLYEYLNCSNQPWKCFLNYWFAVSTAAINSNRLSNNLSHAGDLMSIPIFFRKCLIEFKEFHREHRCDLKNMTSKLIYH